MGNSSGEVEGNEVNSDEEVEQNDDVFLLRANTTPVASFKSCSKEVPVYVGTFWNFYCYFLQKDVHIPYSYFFMFHCSVIYEGDQKKTVYQNV